MRGKYTNMIMGEKGAAGKLALTSLGSDLLAKRQSKTSNQQVRPGSLNNA